MYNIFGDFMYNNSNKKYLIYILDIIVIILTFTSLILLFLNSGEKTPYLNTVTGKIDYKIDTYRLIESEISWTYIFLVILAISVLIISLIKNNGPFYLSGSIVLLSSSISLFILSRYGIDHSYYEKYSYTIFVLSIIMFFLNTTNIIIKYITLRRLY